MSHSIVLGFSFVDFEEGYLWQSFDLLIGEETEIRDVPSGAQQGGQAVPGPGNPFSQYQSKTSLMFFRQYDGTHYHNDCAG